MNISTLNKQFVIQHGQSDCGPACLASVIRYHGGEQSLNQIRRLTGTTKVGTKLLGLYEGAGKLGFETKGLQAEGIDNLKELDEPAILHVIIQNRLQHYVVFYGFDGEKLIIGDPSKGVELWTKEHLDQIWQSRSLLKLTPEESFEKESKSQNKYKQLLAWVKSDLNILMASLFLGLLISVFSLATAIFSQKLIDVILPTKELTKLIVGISLFTLVLLAKSGLNFVRSKFLITQSRDFNNRMINSFFGSLLRLPKLFFDSAKTGEMVARMNDTRKIQSAVSTLVGNMIIESLVVVISLISIMVYSWQIGLVVIFFVPFYAIILWKHNHPIIAAQQETMAKYALNEGNYIDVITGISEVKSTGTIGLFERSTTSIYKSYQDSMFNLGSIQIKFNLKTEIIGLLIMIVVISFSAYLVISGSLMLGIMMAILSLSSSIGPSLTRLTLFNIQLQEARVAFNRMSEFTQMEAEKTKGKKIGKIDKILMEDISFNFPGSLPLFEDLNLTIEKGKMTTLLGESGTGKSTILQLLQRFYSPGKGTIRINDEQLEDLDLNSFRQEVGVVPQEVKIFNNYLLFNIALTDDVEELKKVPEWCQENGFDRFFTKFPQGYMTLLGEEGVNISGGQKQLVGLARALYHNPSVLLIDEGTSAMDSNTEQFILNMIQDEKDNKSVLMVTHRMKVAEQSDVVYLLENKGLKRKNMKKEVLIEMG